MSNKFLAMWDCNGLECLFDITDLEHDAMIASLKNEACKTPFNLTMMMLRARFNNQRSYEIYTFETESDIDYASIEDMFEHTPQTIVNAIRKNGNKIYSDYSPKKGVIT
jgi:hypothetical protein